MLIFRLTKPRTKLKWTACTWPVSLSCAPVIFVLLLTLCNRPVQSTSELSSLQGSLYTGSGSVVSFLSLVILSVASANVQSPSGAVRTEARFRTNSRYGDHLVDALSDFVEGPTRHVNQNEAQGRSSRQLRLIASALRTMGCLPKFFCGKNAEKKGNSVSTLNDLAYLIKFAMADAEFSKPVTKKVDANSGSSEGGSAFTQNQNVKGLAAHYSIKPPHRNWPKPGPNHEQDDEESDEDEEEEEGEERMDINSGPPPFQGKMAPEITSSLTQNIGSSMMQSALTSIVQPLKNMYKRFGRSTSREEARRLQNEVEAFWKSVDFKKELKLAARIGQAAANLEASEGEELCSATFNQCPYSLREMKDLIEGDRRLDASSVISKLKTVSGEVKGIGGSAELGKRVSVSSKEQNPVSSGAEMWKPMKQFTEEKDYDEEVDVSARGKDVNALHMALKTFVKKRQGQPAKDADEEDDLPDEFKQIREQLERDSEGLSEGSSEEATAGKKKLLDLNAGTHKIWTKTGWRKMPIKWVKGDNKTTTTKGPDETTTVASRTFEPILTVLGVGIKGGLNRVEVEDKESEKVSTERASTTAFSSSSESVAVSETTVITSVTSTTSVEPPTTTSTEPTTTTTSTEPSTTTTATTTTPSTTTTSPTTTTTRPTTVSTTVRPTTSSTVTTTQEPMHFSASVSESNSEETSSATAIPTEPLSILQRFSEQVQQLFHLSVPEELPTTEHEVVLASTETTTASTTSTTTTPASTTTRPTPTTTTTTTTMRPTTTTQMTTTSKPYNVENNFYGSFSDETYDTPESNSLEESGSNEAPVMFLPPAYPPYPHMIPAAIATTTRGTTTTTSPTTSPTTTTTTTSTTTFISTTPSTTTTTTTTPTTVSPTPGAVLDNLNLMQKYFEEFQKMQAAAMAQATSTTTETTTTTQAPEETTPKQGHFGPLHSKEIEGFFASSKAPGTTQKPGHFGPLYSTEIEEFFASSQAPKIETRPISFLYNQATSASQNNKPSNRFPGTPIIRPDTFSYGHKNSGETKQDPSSDYVGQESEMVEQDQDSIEREFIPNSKTKTSSGLLKQDPAYESGFRKRPAPTYIETPMSNQQKLHFNFYESTSKPTTTTTRYTTLSTMIPTMASFGSNIEMYPDPHSFENYGFSSNNQDAGAQMPWDFWNEDANPPINSNVNSENRLQQNNGFPKPVSQAEKLDSVTSSSTTTAPRDSFRNGVKKGSYSNEVKNGPVQWGMNTMRFPSKKSSIEIGNKAGSNGRRRPSVPQGEFITTLSVPNNALKEAPLKSNVRQRLKQRRPTKPKIVKTTTTYKYPVTTLKPLPSHFPYNGYFLLDAESNSKSVENSGKEGTRNNGARPWLPHSYEFSVGNHQNVQTEKDETSAFPKPPAFSFEMFDQPFLVPTGKKDPTKKDREPTIAASQMGSHGSGHSGHPKGSGGLDFPFPAPSGNRNNQRTRPANPNRRRPKPTISTIQTTTTTASTSTSLPLPDFPNDINMFGPNINYNLRSGGLMMGNRDHWDRISALRNPNPSTTSTTTLRPYQGLRNKLFPEKIQSLVPRPGVGIETSSSKLKKPTRRRVSGRSTTLTVPSTTEQTTRPSVIPNEMKEITANGPMSSFPFSDPPNKSPRPKQRPGKPLRKRTKPSPSNGSLESDKAVHETEKSDISPGRKRLHKNHQRRKPEPKPSSGETGRGFRGNDEKTGEEKELEDLLETLLTAGQKRDKKPDHKNRIVSGSSRDRMVHKSNTNARNRGSGSAAPSNSKPTMSRNGSNDRASAAESARSSFKGNWVPQYPGNYPFWNSG